MKILYTLILSLLLTITANSQILRGTHVIAARCKNGILIASDSRTNFYRSGSPGENAPDAYIDGVQKIFPHKNAVFTVSYLASVSDTLVQVYFQRIAQQSDTLKSVKDIMLAWLVFTHKRPDLDQFKLVSLLLANYENKKPHMILYNGDRDIQYDAFDYLESINSSFREHYSKKNSWRKTALQMKAAIKQSARANPTVGGKTSILLIRPNNKTKWVLNKSKPFAGLTVRDYWRAYKNRQIIIHFNSKEYQKIMESQIDTLD